MPCSVEGCSRRADETPRLTHYHVAVVPSPHGRVSKQGASSAESSQQGDSEGSGHEADPEADSETGAGNLSINRSMKLKEVQRQVMKARTSLMADDQTERERTSGSGSCGVGGDGGEIVGRVSGDQTPSKRGVPAVLPSEPTAVKRARRH